MNEYDGQTKELASFFKKLATDIETNSLTIEELRLAGQACMNYNFQRETGGVIDSEEDMKKFLFTGWYIYSQLDQNPGNPQQWT